MQTPHIHLFLMMTTHTDLLSRYKENEQDIISDLEDLRRKEIEGCISDEDRSELNDFESLFTWQESFSIQSWWEGTFNEDVEATHDCADAEEAKAIMNHEQNPDQPDPWDANIGGKIDFNDFNGLDLDVSIYDLELKPQPELKETRFEKVDPLFENSVKKQLGEILTNIANHAASETDKVALKNFKNDGYVWDEKIFAQLSYECENSEEWEKLACSGMHGLEEKVSNLCSYTDLGIEVLSPQIEVSNLRKEVK